MVATTADARPWHRHHHHHHHRGGGWVGPAIIGGLALGALATAPSIIMALMAPVNARWSAIRRQDVRSYVLFAIKRIE
jgi:hypothetical protein